MNPFKGKPKQPRASMAPKAPKQIGTSNGYMPKIRKPNIKTPTATATLLNGTPGDNQNFNK